MLRRFFDEGSGQDLIEYGLLVALVVVGVAVVLPSCQNTINSIWTVISNNLQGSS